MVKQSGFTLVELLIVLCIILISAAIVIPSQKIFLDRSEQQVQASQLIRAINLARNEALMRGSPVVLSQSQKGWQDGYSISADEKILYLFQSNPGESQIHWRAARGIEYLQFSPLGLPSGENGTFWYCAKPGGVVVWSIVVNQSGRSRLVEGGESKSLSC